MTHVELQTMLTEAQKQTYKDQGFVLIPQAIGAEKIAAMGLELEKWIEESRSHNKNYGSSRNGKARFDLEPGHSAEYPKLRRISNPVDISQAYRDVLFEGPAIEAAVDVLGPDVKFHHCKLNIKLPGMVTRVDYHQDHPFDVHTNDDHVTLLVLLDDMTEANGCLRIVSGSHLWPQYSHYQGDEFVGKVDAEAQAMCEASATKLEGRAGDICLMNTWCLHGGTSNLSQNPRRLLICDLTAADNFPLMEPQVPSDYTGKVVAGKASRIARFRAGQVEMPYLYESDSFFGAQGQDEEQD
ncbi:MAG TPA: restriction endonuclease subunit S [Oceanospirillaceae bacterium]|nr:restriction endonuclease subunit S [Oceanospirillaceae bacterium]